jgi:hypothetical protein
MELWKRINEFPNYSVSNYGQVRNTKLDRVLAKHINGRGISYVRLSTEHKPSSRSLAVLVAHAFIPPHKSEWFDTPINLDGDRQNNHVSNLMWRPRWFAIRYHQQFEAEVFTYRCDVLLTNTGEIFRNLREPAIKYGLLERDIFLGIANREGVWPNGFFFKT